MKRIAALCLAVSVVAVMIALAIAITAALHWLDPSPFLVIGFCIGTLISVFYTVFRGES